MRSNWMIAGLLLCTSLVFAQEQTTPPAPAAPRQAALPKPVEKTLENGLRVIVVPKTGVPLVSARLMVMTGSERDTAPLAGLASLTASLVTEGTRTRSSEQIDRGVEALGATLRSNVGWGESTVAVNVMSPRFNEALMFVADVVRNPSFKQEEIDRVRAQAIDAVQVSLQDPAALARRVAARVIFRGEPYGPSESGTPESLQRIQREQIVAFHQKHYTPDNAVLVIAGDIKPAAAFATAEKLFGTWKRGNRGNVVTIELRRPAEPVKPPVVGIDMPAAGQGA